VRGGIKMEGGNLLSGGVDTLNEIKENLLELRGYQAKDASLIEEEEKLEKSIDSMEKSIAEEVQATTKKRRDEIEDTFDKQIDKTRARMKRIKEKRDKKKSTKVSERISAETASLHTENSRLRLEAKTLFKQKRIPSFCNTKFYYALYSPSCFTDFLIIVGVIMLTLLLIPCGVYFFLLPQEKVPYLIVTYVVTVLLFGGLYIITGNRTKEKFTEDILWVKGIRKNVRVNKKKIGIIKSNIKKDRDESSYDLQTFDEELTKLEQEVAAISVQKKEALGVFDHSTKQVIASEIQGINEEKLSGLKEEYERVSAESKKAEEMIKALTIKMASEYEPFIGKDLMTLERLESLTNILQAGTAMNISEAIAFYRQSMEAAAQL
jgi:hypothetical protein